MESKHPYRNFCFEKFRELITEQNKILKTKIKPNDLLKKILNLERGIFNYAVKTYNNTQNKCRVWNEDFEYIYRERFRHIYFNLLKMEGIFLTLANCFNFSRDSSTGVPK